MDKIKVLIADDIAGIVEQTKSTLSKMSEIDIIGKANNGQEELEQIYSLNPDLVFTDNQMPILNGIEVIEKIYNDSNLIKKPSFIFATADRNMQLFQKAYSLGVIKIITKPYGEIEIKEAIEEYKLMIDNENKNIIETEFIENKVIVKESLWDKIKKIFKFKINK